MLNAVPQRPFRWTTRNPSPTGPVALDSVEYCPPARQSPAAGHDTDSTEAFPSMLSAPTPGTSIGVRQAPPAGAAPASTPAPSTAAAPTVIKLWNIAIYGNLLDG